MPFNSTSRRRCASPWPLARERHALRRRCCLLSATHDRELSLRRKQAQNGRRSRAWRALALRDMDSDRRILGNGGVASGQRGGLRKAPKSAALVWPTTPPPGDAIAAVDKPGTKKITFAMPTPQRRAEDSPRHRKAPTHGPPGLQRTAGQGTWRLTALALFSASAAAGAAGCKRPSLRRARASGARARPGRSPLRLRSPAPRLKPWDAPQRSQGQKAPHWDDHFSNMARLYEVKSNSPLEPGRRRRYRERARAGARTCKGRRTRLPENIAGLRQERASLVGMGPQDDPSLTPPLPPRCQSGFSERWPCNSARSLHCSCRAQLQDCRARPLRTLARPERLPRAPAGRHAFVETKYQIKMPGIGRTTSSWLLLSSSQGPALVSRAALLPTQSKCFAAVARTTLQRAAKAGAHPTVGNERAI